MSAVEKANELCRDMGYEPAVGCGCGGFWWYDGGRLVMATHTEGCERADAGWIPSLPAAASRTATGKDTG